MIAAYVQHLRDRNAKIASVCYYCNKQSTGINSDRHRIIFVCDNHLNAADDVVLDTSMPGVIHYIYPNGKKIPKHMMDPYVGGYKGEKKNEDN